MSQRRMARSLGFEGEEEKRPARLGEEDQGFILNWVFIDPNKSNFLKDQNEVQFWIK